MQNKTVLALVLLAAHCFGQSRMSVDVLRLLRGSPNKMVSLLVKGDAARIEGSAGRLGATYRYASGNISSLTLPVSSIRTLAMMPFVERIEIPRRDLRPLDDSSRRKNNILPVHAGAPPLQPGYTGQDVIIGLIDTGTDIDHPDFKDPSGATRIAWLWDQRSVTASNTPQPYNYGQEWSAQDIDSGYCTHDDNYDMSHGTKVAGVAAGNGASASQYKGVAPGADIISVAIDFNSSLPVITDALRYILSKAAQMGKPLVVNISLGGYYGSHDGKDLEAELVDSLMGNAPGRALVAAAGNGGGIPFHLGYSVTLADTAFTWITGAGNTINFQVYADSADFSNIRFRMGAHHPVSFSYKGNDGFRSIDTLVGNYVQDSIVANGKRIGFVGMAADLYKGVYTLDVTVFADSLNYLWSFETNGNGRLDAWNFDFVSSGLPNSTTFPAIAKYRPPDTLQTICTGFQCSGNVITVGNYTDRLGFVDASGTYTTFAGIDGEIFPTSSMGPTRDGRRKPEIAATGENIATTGALPIIQWLLANYPYVVTQDSLHMIFGGTSAAAPAVTGLAALYFEKYPGATAAQLKSDIINCAHTDNFTGAAPNDVWGYGKLNGFGAMVCSLPDTTGVSVISRNGKIVFPNPAHDQIRYTGMKAGSRIVITNAMGQAVLTSILPSDEGAIDVTRLATGLYILTTPDDAMGVRFIKD